MTPNRLTRSTLLVLVVALAAVPGIADTIRHRAVAPPSSITVNITGVVSDATTGAPLQNAVVSAEGHNSAPTGPDGVYKIKITAGRNVAVTATHFSHNPQTISIFGVEGRVTNFALTSKGIVTVKMTDSKVYTLDIDSAKFAYLIPFSGYVQSDLGNFCKDDGTSVTPDKHAISRVVGPGTPVNYSPCCTIGPIIKANLEMKTGEKFAIYFNDSCFGNEVDFLGRDTTSPRGDFLYFRMTEIAEIDFP